MSKVRITAAAVLAAHEVLDQYTPPENYFKVSSDEQRRIRLSIIRLALIAAYTADQNTEKVSVSPDQARNELCRREEAGVDPRVPLTAPDNVANLTSQQLNIAKAGGDEL
jgi:hypothetical protein